MPLFAYIYDRSQVTQCCRRAVTMLFRRILDFFQLKRRKSSAIADTVRDFQEMPSPRGWPIIGTTLDLIAAGSAPQLHNYIDKRHKQLGSIFKEKLGPTSCVFVSDPEVIRSVFAQEGKFPQHFLPDSWVEYNRIYGCQRGIFFMDGPEWWHFRRIANKMLLRGDSRWINEACDVVCENFVELLLENSSSDQCYENLTGTLYKWSLDVIISILVGAYTYQAHYQELEERVTELAKIIHLVFETSAKLSLIPVSIASTFKIPPWNRFVEAVHRALEESNSLVTILKDLNTSCDGLLCKLIDEDVDIEDIQRIIVDLILAAGDTTAVTFEWMLYLITKNPEYQDKLRENPDLARYIMKEAMRMYPVATFLTRILPEDGVIGGFGVPKDTLVVMSMFTCGRDGNFFQEPDTFAPERWDRKGCMYHNGMLKASAPFGIGTRSCPGKRISEIQLQKTLLRLVDNFDIELCNVKDVEITMKMVAVPSEALRLKFKKR